MPTRQRLSNAAALSRACRAPKAQPVDVDKMALRGWKLAAASRKGSGLHRSDGGQGSLLGQSGDDLGSASLLEQLVRQRTVCRARRDLAQAFELFEDPAGQRVDGRPSGGGECLRQEGGEGVCSSANLQGGPVEVEVAAVATGPQPCNLHHQEL